MYSAVLAKNDLHPGEEHCEISARYDFIDPASRGADRSEPNPCSGRGNKAVRCKTISGVAVALDWAVSGRTRAGGDGCARTARSFLFWKRGRWRLENE